MTEPTQDNVLIRDKADLPEYDTQADQYVALEIEEGGQIYNVSYLVGAVNPFLAEYDRLREVSLVASGGDQVIETQSSTADEWLFDQIAKDVAGFEGEKPENWLELIDPAEKSHVVRRLLAVKPVSADAPAVKAKRSWTAERSNTETIRLLSFFDGQEVETAITLKRPRPSDVSKYNRIKARIALSEGKGLEDSAIKIPAQMAAKAEIGEEVCVNVSGYNGSHHPPLHHMALAVTMLFEKDIRSAQKK